MTSAELERRYRRWLRWYPPSFRREYEEELLGVLMEGAQEGERSRALRDCLDLAVNGLWARVVAARRAIGGRSAAVLLLYLGALLELAAAATILATADSVSATIRPAISLGAELQRQATVTAQLDRVAIGAVVAAGAWLLIAWGVTREYRWAACAVAVLVALNLFGLLRSCADGSAAHAPADLAAGTALCVVQVVAAVVLFGPVLVARRRGLGPRLQSIGRPGR